jgi:chromosome segregation ATPase
VSAREQQTDMGAVIARLADEAERRGELKGVVDSHEQRLGAINGNIRRHAEEVGRLRRESTEEMGRLREGIAGLARQFAERESAAEAVAKQTAELFQKRIARRDKWLGVAAIVTLIATSLISGHPVHITLP